MDFSDINIDFPSPNLVRIMPATPQVTLEAGKTQPHDALLQSEVEVEVVHLPVAPATQFTALVVKPATDFEFYVPQDLLAFHSPELNRLASRDINFDGLHYFVDLVLDDVEEDVIRGFVDWVYTTSYNPQWRNVCDCEANKCRHWDDDSSIDSLIVNVKMYIFGDRFNIAPLQKVAMAKVRKTMSTYFWIYTRFFPDLVDIILHAFNKLSTEGLFTTPKHGEGHSKTVVSLSDPDGGDEMLRFWIQLMASKMPFTQAQTRYTELISNHKICMALLQKGVLDCRSKPAPWKVPKLGEAEGGLGGPVGDEDDFLG